MSWQKLFAVTALSLMAVTFASGGDIGPGDALVLIFGAGVRRRDRGRALCDCYPGKGLDRSPECFQSADRRTGYGLRGRGDRIPL